MPNYIIYHCSSTDEINECAYSLLKYLDVYNLKPPSGHQLVVYTSYPALLEAFGSFFQVFDLKEMMAAERGDAKTLQLKNLEQYKGNILHLPVNAYPTKELETLFDAVGRGAIFLQKPAVTEQRSTVKSLPILAFNSEQHRAQDVLGSQEAQSPGGFIEQYEDLKEFGQLLKDFFKRYHEESIPNQVKLMHTINARQIQDEKGRFMNLPLHIRLLRKLTGKGWKISGHRPRI